MIDQEIIQHLSSAALAWARAQEHLILTRGSPLGKRALEDAVRAGVREPERIRILVVDRIPLPEDPQLAEAARRTNIITESSRAVTIGYGILLRAISWGDRELLLHQLVHVAQCERSGGLDPFVEQYLKDRQTCADFTVGSLEEEARALAREISVSGTVEADHR